MLKQTQLIRAVRRYWWLLVVVPLISTIATYGFFSLQPRTYQAVSTLLIRGPALSQEGGLPLSTQETLNTYAFLITQEPVLEAVIDKLHLGYSAEDLAQQVTVQLQTNTGLLDVYVVDSDPNRAAAIDNAIDDAFIAQISARLDAEAATQEAAYQTQIDAIQSDIDRLTSEIATLSVKAPSSETATKLAGDQIQLDSDLTTQTQLRSSLLGLRASTVLKGDEIIVARVAGSGTLVGVASRTDLLAAFAGGLILAIAVILTLLLLDSRVTSTQQLAEATRGLQPPPSLALASAVSYGRLVPDKRRVPGRNGDVTSSWAREIFRCREPRRFAGEAWLQIRVAGRKRGRP
jgi:capsular polysaccharide biosynthesis protein